MTDEYRNCKVCESNFHIDEFSYSEDGEQTLTPKAVVCNYCFGDICFAIDNKSWDDEKEE